MVVTRRLRVPDHTVLVQVLCGREDGAVLLRKIDEGSGSSLAGLWAGLLGEVEDAETLEDAARRLASPLTLPSLQRVAHFQFTEAGDPSSAYEHEMIARSPLGPLPDGCRWVPRAELEFASMPADDRHWYPRVLDGDLLAGSFHFAADKNQLQSMSIRALDKLIDDEPNPGYKPFTSVMHPDGSSDSLVRYTD